MPITKSAKKALKVSRKKENTNRKSRDRVKKVVKEFEKKLSPESLRIAYCEIDKSVKKHLIHKNKASRIKSKLAKMLKNKPSKEVKATPKKSKKTAEEKTSGKMSKK